MELYESGENYIETILILKKRNGQVKSIDIARELSYSKASISRAVGILREDGFIVIDGDGMIELTRKGKEKAEKVYDRHRSLTDFLMATAGIPAETAEKDACKIEHIISEETFQGIKNYLKQHIL